MKGLVKILIPGFNKYFSYLPWFKTFYSVLDKISQFSTGDSDDKVVILFFNYSFFQFLKITHTPGYK